MHTNLVSLAINDDALGLLNGGGDILALQFLCPVFHLGWAAARGGRACGALVPALAIVVIVPAILL